MGARKGDEGLAPLPVPAGLEVTWRAEEDFVRLLSGEDVGGMRPFRTASGTSSSWRRRRFRSPGRMGRSAAALIEVSGAYEGENDG